VQTVVQTVMQIAQTNGSVLSLLPSKLSSLAALELYNEWHTVGAFPRMACAISDAAFVAASVMSS